MAKAPTVRKIFDEADLTEAIRARRPKERRHDLIKEVTFELRSTVADGLAEIQPVGDQIDDGVAINVVAARVGPDGLIEITYAFTHQQTYRLSDLVANGVIAPRAATLLTKVIRQTAKRRVR